jgi:hypothetical protein
MKQIYISNNRKIKMINFNQLKNNYQKFSKIVIQKHKQFYIQLHLIIK